MINEPPYREQIQNVTPKDNGLHKRPPSQNQRLEDAGQRGEDVDDFDELQRHPERVDHRGEGLPRSVSDERDERNDSRSEVEEGSEEVDICQEDSSVAKDASRLLQSLCRDIHVHSTQASPESVLHALLHTIRHIRQPTIHSLLSKLLHRLVCRHRLFLFFEFVCLVCGAIEVPREYEFAVDGDGDAIHDLYKPIGEHEGDLKGREKQLHINPRLPQHH
mmetsp:Transcript_19273/g.46065  ORF Transcript_19273/g.46065 Transcript_19273/m.46065 type:complete len:219 (-) Transcript_19273:292-948(-)